MFGTLHNGPRLDMTTETSEVWTARCPTMLWEPAEFEVKDASTNITFFLCNDPLSLKKSYYSHFEASFIFKLT